MATQPKYYGEYYVRTAIKLAPNAVVILNRLCYASGNSEWGRPNPTKTVAKQRVDNFGAGFLRAGARAVFADGITSASYVLYGLFSRTGRSASIFTSSSNFVGAYDFKFASARTPGYTAWMAPKSVGRYYRSVIGNLGSHCGDIPRQLIRTERLDPTAAATEAPARDIVPAGAVLCVGKRPGPAVSRDVGHDAEHRRGPS